MVATPIEAPKSDGPLGIIAGGGGFPVAVAECVLAEGRAVFIVGLMGQTDDGIERFRHEIISFGELRKMVRRLKEEGCREIVFIGTARRPDLRKLRVDIGGIRALPYFLKIALGGDDKLLSGIVRYFEGHGFIVRGAHEIAPHLVANAGNIGRYKPNADDEADALLGQRLIETLGPFDVGQAVIVARRRVLTIEAAEGTDRMLERCRDIRKLMEASPGKRTGVLVKFPKPQQDMRVDMPVIGPETVRRASAAGLRGIAIASSGVLIAEREATIDAANEEGLFVTGLAWPLKS